MQIDYPWRLDRGGRTAVTDDDDHIRDLIEQVLFTTPGERVNRPSFGSGVLRLLFAPNNTSLAATAQLLVQASLQEWLGDLIEVDGVTFESPAESTIQVTVAFRSRSDLQRHVMQFTRSV